MGQILYGREVSDEFAQAFREAAAQYPWAQGLPDIATPYRVTSEPSPPDTDNPIRPDGTWEWRAHYSVRVIEGEA